MTADAVIRYIQEHGLYRHNGERVASPANP
jgi:hypothetical protein